ncbi:MAG TPA: dihydrodipicolinate synthase family protein [Luteitalea sp.]|nr:dihydrodipicolinate synthase family protein [Luteitalea sp.]
MRGILPATVTPFDDAGRFARRPFERLLDRVYEAGVHGVYVCGTTGEGPLMARTDREAVAEAAVASTPRGKHVIVHVGAASTEDTLHLARHAARIGAHAISSLPPFAAPLAFPDVLRYYETLAGSTELPLVAYFFPQMAPAMDSLERLEILCNVPNVAGVKYTDFDLYRLSCIATPGRAIFNGRDEVLAAGLLMGATGGIGSFYNLVPGAFVRLFEATEAGRWDEARAAQLAINRLIRVVLEFPLFPAIKTMLGWSGLACGACLPPRVPLSPAQETALKAALDAAALDDLLGNRR